ncbi:Release factor glutamine methyltransferase [Candidatus Hepatincola sp. Pdp]
MKVNNVYLGDCLELLKKIPSNYIDIIYLDPPFCTQKEHQLKNKEGLVYRFNDIWHSIDEYIQFLEKRLIECKRVLKETGTIFIHCDKQACHYIRILLDNIFGYNNFINEIIWSYKRWSNNRNGLLNTHQNIFWYSKSKVYTFNPIYQEYSTTTNIDQLLFNRERNSTNNKTQYSEKSSQEKKGVLLGDVWEIPFLNPRAKERVNYPTQKPIILLEQIINISSNQGDIILDPFCGSGSTLVASKLLQRNYIGIDISSDAVKLAKHRLDNPVKTESNLLKNGKESYITKENIKNILDKIGAKIVYRSSKVDGILTVNSYGLIAVKIQQAEEDLLELQRNLSIFINSKSLKFGIIIINDKNEYLLNSRSFTLYENIKMCTFSNAENIIRDF